MAADTPQYLSWTVSNSQTASVGVTYGFSFTTASAQRISRITFDVAPGTAGHCQVGTVYGLGGRHGLLSARELTYRLANIAMVPAGTRVEVSVAGLTNTPIQARMRQWLPPTTASTPSRTRPPCR